jgi:hypothetical protein
MILVKWFYLCFRLVCEQNNVIRANDETSFHPSFKFLPRIVKHGFTNHEFFFPSVSLHTVVMKGCQMSDLCLSLATFPHILGGARKLDGQKCMSSSTKFIMHPRCHSVKSCIYGLRRNNVFLVLVVDKRCFGRHHLFPSSSQLGGFNVAKRHRHSTLTFAFGLQQEQQKERKESE